MLPTGNYPKMDNGGFNWMEALERLSDGECVRIGLLSCERVELEPDQLVWEVTDERSMDVILSTADLAEAVLFLMSSWDNGEDRGQIIPPL